MMQCQQGWEATSASASWAPHHQVLNGAGRGELLPGWHPEILHQVSVKDNTKRTDRKVSLAGEVM